MLRNDDLYMKLLLSLQALGCVVEVRRLCLRDRPPFLCFFLDTLHRAYNLHSNPSATLVHPPTRQVTDVYGRAAPAAAVLRSYQKDRLNTLEGCGPVPKPLPERTPIRMVSALPGVALHEEKEEEEEEEESKEEEEEKMAVVQASAPSAPAANAAAASAAASGSPAHGRGGSAGGAAGVLSTPPQQPRARLEPRPPARRPDCPFPFSR